MPYPKHRIKPLSDLEKHEFLRKHIPRRISMVEEAATRMDSSYYDLTVAAVHCRALAQFLGLKLSRSGQIKQDPTYFPHEDNDSFEVKLQDVCSQPLLSPKSFSPDDLKALADGFDTINREVAHLTLWDQPARHHGQDDPRSVYYSQVVLRVRRFCTIVLAQAKNALQQA